MHETLIICCGITEGNVMLKWRTLAQIGGGVVVVFVTETQFTGHKALLKLFKRLVDGY